MQGRLVDVTVKIKQTDSWLYSSCLHFKKKKQSNFKVQCKRRKGRMSLSLTHPSPLLFITEEAKKLFHCSLHLIYVLRKAEDLQG